MQRCAAVPPLDENRDRAALARHLGPKAFVQWLRSLLTNDLPGENAEEPWHAGDGHVARSTTESPGFGSLTLEDMLACWARDRNAFERADRRFKSYVDLFVADDTVDAAELAALQELKSVWETLANGLQGQR
jgi:hypothetical protein